jgi:hypothetical protein
MPQLQNLVLTDRAATPVNHTFVPREIDSSGVGMVVESSGVPIGDNRFSVGLRRTSEGRCKATLKGVFPIVQTQTVNGISTPVVVRTAYADVTFSFDSTSTEQERKDCVGMLASSLDPAKVLVNDTLVKLQGVY